jgi:hypothetical protein
MLDLISIGYSQLVSSWALIGGFCSGGTFFFLSQYARDDISERARTFNFIGFIYFFACFLIILIILSTIAITFINTDSNLPENSQILINFSCSDKMNCSGNIPSQMQISCQERSCPPQIICPNVSSVSKELQYSKSFKCPPILSIPGTSIGKLCD